MLDAGGRTSLWQWLAPAGLLAAVLGSFLLPPLPQDPDYHHFSDARTLLGVPHFWNVVSNLPFLLVGSAGIWQLLRGRLVYDPENRLPFFLLFLGVGLTAFGSTYYHLDPSNERLLWDRLPMAVAFMGLFAALLGERTRPRVGPLLVGPFVLLGAGSVLFWYVSERQGAGNLRPYLAMQFYPLVLIPVLLLLTPARFTRGVDYLIAGGWYGIAKLLEQTDREVHSLLGHIGGHPLKHVVAALGAYWLLRMLRLRKRCEAASGEEHVNLGGPSPGSE
jgi:hypothetical protein